ncbi:MAG TPA: hypothetical protein ENH53_12465, partial [Bacteroidetes bacterium]|nr:hypothetical protein [Bacteroidota bacterium]
LLFFVLAAFILVIYSPYYGLLLTLFVEFSGIVWGFKIPMGFFAVVLLTALSWFFHRIVTFRWHIFWDSLYVWIIAFLAIVLISSFAAMDKIQSLSILFLYFKIGLYYFLITQILDSAQRVKGAVIMIIFATLFSVIVGLIGMFAPLPFLGSSMQTWRFRGLTSDPNILGIHLLIIIPFIFLSFFSTQTKFKRSLIALLFLFSILGLVATFSRSSTIGLAVILAYLFYLKRREKTIILLVTLIFFLAIYFVPADFWQRILSVGNIQQDPSLRWRAELYRGAWQFFIHHPILGIGAGNFVLQSHVFVAQHLAVHNTLLEVATETGILGFLLFVLIISIVVARLIEAKKIFEKRGNSPFSLYTKSFLVGLLGIFIVSFFYSIEEYFVVWTIFAMGSVLYFQAKKSDEMQ